MDITKPFKSKIKVIPSPAHGGYFVQGDSQCQRLPINEFFWDRSRAINYKLNLDNNAHDLYRRLKYPL